MEQMLTVPEVVARLRLSRAKTYQLLGREIPVVRFGRSVRVSAAVLDSYLSRKVAEGQEQANA